MAEVLVIIPARGGSKGIPRKNIRNFAGYPLISWSISAGLQARKVSRVIVSTDDEEIADVARQWGAEVPFMRPRELAQDRTTDLPVFQHAINWLAEHENYHPGKIIQLRPTSPVRPRNCVEDAIQTYLNHPEADSLRAVVESGQNPYKMWRINAQTGHMEPLQKLAGMKEPYNAPRQSLPPTYWQTGHIDIIRPETILAGSMSGKIIIPLVLDYKYAIDLDTLDDWEHAEWLISMDKKRGKNKELDIVWPE